MIEPDNLVTLIIIKLMLFIVNLSTDILESEEFNPPVDSFDQLTESSTISSIEGNVGRRPPSAAECNSEGMQFPLDTSRMEEG